jgi:hypothetical protein
VHPERVSRRDFLARSARLAAAGWYSRTRNNFELQTPSSNCGHVGTLADSRLKPPIVGAIRWDGWFRDSVWAGYISDQKWQNRWPFYAVRSGSSAEIRGDEQEIVDREIQFANFAGLDYWAYCYYDATSEEYNRYNYGLRLHRSSTIRQSPNIAVIVQGSHIGDQESWSGFTDRLVELFLDDRYQKIDDDRPLVFMYDVGRFNAIFQYYDKSMSALELLRNKSLRAGLSNPYIVGQNLSGELVHLGFDGFGAYTANGIGLGKRPYNDLIDANTEYWDWIKSENRVVVPTLNSGWDGRPRISDPVIGRLYQYGPWYDQPRAEQLSDLTEIGVEWVRNNANCAEEQILLFYAWNEFDEGGWLVPTLAEGTSRIEALREVLLPTKGVDWDARR